MKPFNKLGVVLLTIFLFTITSGCGGHLQENSTGTESTSVSTTSITQAPDNITSTTVDIEKIMEEQRVHLEHEKSLKEDPSIAAKVNDTLIYQFQIEIEMNKNHLNLETYRMQLNAMNLSEQEKNNLLEMYTANLQLNKKDILNEFIRNTVIEIEVEKRGLFPTDEEVMMKAKEHFAGIKKIPDMYASAQLYMDVMNLSEDDYLHLIIDEHKKAMGLTNLYQQITAGIETDADKTAAFTASVDKWVNQADIDIINTQE